MLERRPGLINPTLSRRHTQHCWQCFNYHIFYKILMWCFTDFICSSHVNTSKRFLNIKNIRKFTNDYEQDCWFFLAAIAIRKIKFIYLLLI